jgi:ornithine cyclodeaminase/alanine dehydrogenase-like protein (mu-crystallin family)
VSVVHPVVRAIAFDIDPGKSARLVSEGSGRFTFPVTAAASLEDATMQSGIIITCTPSRHPFLKREGVPPGTFVAAVGADNEDKSEISPELMAEAAVVVDSLEQCAAIGDLHHALAAGVMTREDVRADLGEVIVEPARGRRSRGEIVVFDSTGVAIQDVVAAALVYERAEREGIGQRLALAE